MIISVIQKESTAGITGITLEEQDVYKMLRDGPFDIQGGGGAGIFPCDKLFFFFLFAQQVIFFKSKLQQVFYFCEKITH